VISFLLIVRIALPAHLPRRAAGGVKSAFEGVRMIAQRADLRALFLLACIPTFFVFPYIQFLSIFARDILEIGAAGMGLLMGASGLGAVAGSLLTAKRRSTSGEGRLNVILTVIYGAFVVGIALSPWVWLSLPCLFVAGAVGAMYMSSNNALIQLRISDEVRGRVMAAYMLTFGLMPLGAMPMGIVADLLSTQAAVAGGAIASSLLAAIVGFRSQALRKI
jgi:MFS family permease